jgi:hypothetical protein
MQIQPFNSLGQESQFEGYLFPRPPSRSPLHIRRIVKAADEWDHCRDLIIATLIAVLSALLLSHATPVMVLLVIAGLMDGSAHFVLYLRQRHKRYDFPVREFLVKERTWIMMRIRMLTMSKSWATAPALAALAVFILASRLSLIGVLLSIVGMAALWAFIQVMHHVSITKPLLLRLSEINRRLAEYDGRPNSTCGRGSDYTEVML